MKSLRILLPVFLLAFGSLAVRAQERTAVHAILLIASNAKGPTDPRLAPYEPTLRRILRFESYRFVGQDSGAVADGAEARLGIGDGHSLTVTPEPGPGRGVRLRVLWLEGRRTLMETGLTLRPGVPAVLGGPSTGRNGEVYAVIVVGE